MTSQKTFLITGVSSGFGRAFAVEALHAGYRVVGTVRRPEDASAYEALDEANAVAKIVDMTDEKALAAMVDEVYEPIREARRRNNGHQPGDPERAAAVMLRLIDDENPPRHLVLGSAALDALAASRAAFDADVRRWEDLTRSTDFPDNR